MERLQKVLAAAGIGSRREIEEWIKAGRVSVNGSVVSLGVKIGPKDKIFLDGKPVRFSREPTTTTKVLMYHKPEGEICTRHDPENRPTVFDNLPPLSQGRWVAIGRLDVNTLGLLLFTNNGELANRLMHPSYEIPREYAVRVLGNVEKEVLQNLLQGVQLEDGIAKFDEISLSGGTGANVWYHVSLREGRNREIRRLWESQGVKVSRLIRVRFDKIKLPRDLKRGKFQELTTAECNQLLEAVGLEAENTTKQKFSKAPGGRRRRFER